MPSSWRNAPGRLCTDLLSGVFLVARRGELLLKRAYGFASWELGVPNTSTGAVDALVSIGGGGQEKTLPRSADR